VFVAVDENDQAIAVSRVIALSPREVWLGAARVHPDHQRQGIGGVLNAASVSWGRARGAIVAGLLTENDNMAARGQVAKLGYREVAHWFYASRILDANGSVDPAADGMHPDESPQPLSIAPAVDIEPAYLSWSGSELAHAAHGLYPVHWAFRRMSIDDLIQAVHARHLYEAPSGWVVMIPDGAGSVRIPWLVTIADDGYSFLRALTARVVADRHTHIGLLLPAVPWLRAAAEQAGFTVVRNTVWNLEI